MFAVSQLNEYRATCYIFKSQFFHITKPSKNRILQLKHIPRRVISKYDKRSQITLTYQIGLHHITNECRATWPVEIQSRVVELHSTVTCFSLISVGHTTKQMSSSVLCDVDMYAQGRKPNKGEFMGYTPKCSLPKFSTIFHWIFSSPKGFVCLRRQKGVYDRSSARIPPSSLHRPQDSL